MYFEELAYEFEIRHYKMFPPSNAELNKIFNQYDNLPKAYIELLELIGAGTSAPFWSGCEFFIRDIPLLKKYAQETLSENSSTVELKNDDFVFWMSQGTIFCFFNLNEGDDPPVYFFTEANPNEFQCVANTLTDFIWNNCFEPQIAFEEIS